jgi:hypothetical protein
MHKDPKRVLTTGSFQVRQCNPRQKPFVAFGNVPGAVSQAFIPNGGFGHIFHGPERWLNGRQIESKSQDQV